MGLDVVGGTICKEQPVNEYMAAVCSCICDHTWDDMSCDFLDVFKPLLPFRIDEWET